MLEYLRVKKYKYSTSLLHFSVNCNISLNFDASIVKILMVKVMLQCTLSLNQTHILEDSRISYQISNLFFPQNSHSQPDTQKFPWEVSFSISTLSKRTLAEVCDSDWKVRRISCYIRSSLMGFHLSVLCLTCWFRLKSFDNFLSHNEQLNECTLTCSFRFESLDNFLSHNEQLNGFSS